MIPYLGIFATHPIQYHVPLWRKLAARSDVRIHVYYANDLSVKGGIDPEFGIPVKWDVPLLEGYKYSFLKNISKNPGLGKGFWGLNCPEVKSICRQERFDAVLVHGYSLLFELQVFQAAWHENIPIMIRGDNREGTGMKKSFAFEYLRSMVLKQLYRRVNIGLAVGKYMRRHFLRHGMKEEDIIDCVHCIDTDLMQRQKELFLPQRNRLRSEAGITHDDVVLLFLGKLIPVKNPSLLVRALQHLKLIPNLWIIVVGEGELRQKTERDLKQIMGAKAIFPGFVNQSEIGKYYVMGDVFVLPSKRETWGLVVNEAMLFGLPALVSDRVGCREDLVINGKTGFVFPSDDETALVNNLQDILNKPYVLKQLGQTAAEHIKRYNADAAVEGIIKALERIRMQRRS